MRRFRHLQGAEVDQAVADLSAWRYPRGLVEFEKEESGWWRHGPDCILWLQPVDVLESTAALHICAHPKTRGYHLVGARRLFMGIDILADFYCLERIIASDCDPAGRVSNYLERLGWTVADLLQLEDGPWYEKVYPPFGES